MAAHPSDAPALRLFSVRMRRVAVKTVVTHVVRVNPFNPFNLFNSFNRLRLRPHSHFSFLLWPVRLGHFCFWEPVPYLYDMRDGPEIISLLVCQMKFGCFGYRQMRSILLAETIRERGAKAPALTGIHALKVPPLERGVPFVRFCLTRPGKLSYITRSSTKQDSRP